MELLDVNRGEVGMSIPHLRRGIKGKTLDVQVARSTVFFGLPADLEIFLPCQLGAIKRTGNVPCRSHIELHDR